MIYYVRYWIWFETNLTIETENIQFSEKETKVEDSPKTNKVITKSGLNHRFRKIKEIANKLRENEKC